MDSTMARGNIKPLLLFIVTTLMLILVTSCSKPYTKIDEPSYASAITEDVLITRNNFDYEKYLEFFSADDRKFETEDIFKSSVNFVKLHWGDYIPGSKRFNEAWLDRTFNEVLKAPYNIKFIRVYYYAKFTNRPDSDIPIMVAFIETKSEPDFRSINFNVSEEEHWGGNTTIIVN